MNYLFVRIVRDSNGNIDQESSGIRTKLTSALFYHRESKNKQETQKQQKQTKTLRINSRASPTHPCPKAPKILFKPILKYSSKTNKYVNTLTELAKLM